MGLFRSTGSYEPDLSLAFHYGQARKFRSTGSYEPDPNGTENKTGTEQFRSTGSYEPDQYNPLYDVDIKSFDPQALTSLTSDNSSFPSVL